MKLTIANAARARYLASLMEFLSNSGEDVGQVASNICNFPFVEDEEEGVIEVVVKVVKKDYDECMQERVDYVNHVQEVAEKKAKKAAESKAKKEKIKAD